MTDLAATAPLTGAQALIWAVPILKEAGVHGSPRDARILLAHAIGIPQGRLTFVTPDPLDRAAWARYRALIARRAARTPVSHLTGIRAFYGHDFIVTPDVLDPRPDTEVLVQAALDHPFTNVLDLGTGSGCILLSLLAARPEATGSGLDVSPAALTVARANAEKLGVIARARFVCGDWVAMPDEAFDLIVANPPYIALDEMVGLDPEVRDHEPHAALTDGADGLTAYREILAILALRQTPATRVLFEIGPTQGQAVLALMETAGLHNLHLLPDLDGRDRVAAGAWPARPT